MSEVVSVRPRLSKYSHRTIARLKMKARREKKRAAIPKFSPAVREQGSDTENKSTSYSISMCVKYILLMLNAKCYDCHL